MNKLRDLPTSPITDMPPETGPAETTQEDVYAQLVRRVGAAHFRRRFNLQVRHAEEILGQGRTLLHIENVEWMMIAIHYGLKTVGLYGVGRRNFLDVQVVHNRVHIPHLPEPFDGLRVLHLSDLHLDLDRALTPVVIDRVKDLAYDLCVITGDYRASTSGSYRLAMEETARLVAHLKPPVYGVLGNHDFIEFVPHLEDAGIAMLLNENVVLTRAGEQIVLAGIDDPHFYQTDDLHKSLAPHAPVTILLSHSPETYRGAAACGYDLMLCGHTHAGQICLPGRRPISGNAACPAEMIYGPWRYGQMQGYTSSGTGSTGVPIRFFCPPEVVIHELVRRT